MVGGLSFVGVDEEAEINVVVVAHFNELGEEEVSKVIIMTIVEVEEVDEVSDVVGRTTTSRREIENLRST